MFNVREKILEKLAKLEANREETLEKLKEKEVFYLGKLSILLELMLISQFGIYFYFVLKIAKLKYYYISVLDFCTSPYFIAKNIPFIVMLIFIIAFFLCVKVKINLRENYIKINLGRKIYFDDIESVEIKKYGDIDVINKSGKKFRIISLTANLAKLLFILKENLKPGTVTVKEKTEEQNYVKKILKLVGLYILIKCVVVLVMNIGNNISEKYRYNLDFSKYGLVREELSDGGYAEYNYKHGKKNGLAKYYDFSGTVVKEIEYKNNEKLKEKEYTDDGMIAKESEYDENGNEKVKKYSSEGKVKEELTIEGGICKRKLYTESGVLILEETTVNHMRYGDKKIVYYPNGKIFMKAEFNEKGRLLPPVKVYDENGRLRLEEEYNKKQEFYVHRIFDENGKLIKTKEKLVSSWQEVYSMKIAIINYFEKDGIYENEIEMFKNFLENEK